MNDENATIDFCGVLARVSLADVTADLFFFPWAFDATPGKRPILRVNIRNPALLPADFEGLLREGVEIAIQGNRLDIWRETDHGQVALDVEVLSTEWVAYGLEDYVERVNQLDERLARQWDELRGAEKKIDVAIKLSHELIRRAGLKGQHSEEMRARQGEAVRVLRRIIDTLEERDD